MQILCDQNVPQKYVDALSDTGGITVSTVREKLSADASDQEIAMYAADNDWVILTNDSDFFGDGREFGLLVYSQLEDPRPGEIIDAVQAIDSAYETNSEVVEVVPDGWV
ncbi:DUF5615 family PIN-like protein [Halorubrum vacuolatum]|uniref:DUF5615 domain-containing protein n=1 Tax=Halorubrum vacuolatum TaxID=63740 RepID=A0A238WN45_HALVU|nr:DUF5615 family PIN-like protein [Halorubrum vacuolatum]SNR48010.1 hypothetical protein SAMN06264855_1095 [Halorubrum vacuolatum]